MSPLRYQKWLRLNEVRRPMLNEHYDVTTAAYAVGYESYPISRSQDIAILRKVFITYPTVPTVE